MTSVVESMFKQTCRTCLSTNGEMVPIFSSHIYVDQLPKKLMAFTKVEISGSDDMPKMICKKCLFMADSFYCFKEQCKSSDNELRKLLAKKNSHRDHSSEIDETLDSEDRSKKSNDAPVTRFKQAALGVINTKIEAKNVEEISQETEESFLVEYVSDEVRVQVENASKRRQEAEKQICMDRVSQRIKSLDGIEVVPIGDGNSMRNERNDGIKKEEIVVFPLKVPQKRCHVIETIVINHPPLSKKLRLPPETTVSKVNTEVARKPDSVVHGKSKKLHFSTVRRVVRIDDDERCIESRDANIKESDKEDSQIKYDTDIVEVSNDNGEQNTQLQHFKIVMDSKRSKTDSAKQEKARTEDNMQGNFVVEDLNSKTKLVALENMLPTNKKNTDDRIDKNKKSQIMFTENCLAEMINSREAKKSAIDCIITRIVDANSHVKQPDKRDVSILKNDKESSKSFGGHTTDKIDEVFIEKVAGNAGKTPAIDEDTKIEEAKAINTLKCNSNSISDNQRKSSGENLSCSNEVTPLALLRVNSSGEENSMINLRIYKRNDWERIAGTTEVDSFVKEVKPVSSSQPNAGNSNTKFYQCNICSINFSSLPSVLQHNMKIHAADQSPYSCLICEKSFQDKSLLSQHVEEHSGSKPYKCTFCPKTFALQRNFKSHVTCHVNYESLECRICMKRFTEKSTLKFHMHLHTEAPTFPCKSCNVSFNRKTNWRRHVMTVHKKANVVVCKLCNKELPNKRSLGVHTRVHTGNKPYQCPHCDKKFTQQCNLNTHIHCHLNDRPFVCPHCGKGFNQRGTRDNHILIHTGEKPHKCRDCGAVFTVASSLKRHMWIHTDEDRPYNCDKCKLQFVGLYELRRHLKNRHGEIVKPENPRVERVQLSDHKNKHSDILGEPNVEFNETGKTDAVQSSEVIESCKSVITAKENSSLSCNVDKIRDMPTEELKDKFSESKIECLNNGREVELANNSDTFVEGEAES